MCAAPDRPSSCANVIRGTVFGSGNAAVAYGPCPMGGGGACGVKVLMLSNLVKSRVTALLPRWVEGEGGGEG